MGRLFTQSNYLLVKRDSEVFGTLVLKLPLTLGSNFQNFPERFNPVPFLNTPTGQSRGSKQHRLGFGERGLRPSSRPRCLILPSGGAQLSWC